MDLNPIEDDPLRPTTYKKRYSSSWFYGQQDNSFPTIEEQVELCRKIASQLVNDENKESKGASMFYKRVKRAPKWVHQSSRITSCINNSGSTGNLNIIGVDDKLGIESNSITEDEREQIEKMKQRLRDETRKPLKLILDPRELKSVERLRKSGTSFSEHNVISPDVCHNLVKDLNSPDINKGAQIFLKRKEKSTQWIVEENQATRDIREIKERQEKQLETMTTGSELSYSRPESRLSSYNNNNQLPLINSQQQNKLLEQQSSQQRVRLVQSPWEAALTTGNVDNAFITVTPSKIVQTVKEMASVKKQSSSFDNQLSSSLNDGDNITSTINRITSNSNGINTQKINYNKELYLARAPRGWNTNEPRQDDGQLRPLSNASFYQQHYYQPGPSSYSPLNVGASLPDSSRNSSRLGIYDQPSISEPTTITMTTADSTSTTFNRNVNPGISYSNQLKSLHTTSSSSTLQPNSVEYPHFDLLSFASSQNNLPKYRDFNSSPRGFFRSTG